MHKFGGMQGEAGAARQLAGLLRGSGGELAAQRVARLVAEASVPGDPAEAARYCAALRDALLELCEEGALSPAEARMLSREIDSAQAATLEVASSAHRALLALEGAMALTSVGDLPQLALQGATSADSAALLLEEAGSLCARSVAGLEIPAEATRPGSIAAAAIARKVPVEAADAEGARCVLALPVRTGATVGAVLRIASRTAWQISAAEEGFLQALAVRAGSLLSQGDPETRLQNTFRTFESLIEASPLPIIAVDTGGLVQIWNRAAEELFGWTRREAVGKPLPAVPGEHAEDAAALQQELEGGSVVRNRETRRTRKDGTPIDLAFSAAPLRDATGAVSGSIAIMVDITDRKQREEEAERTARFREHFVGIVSHDLRNPLTAIVTSAELLLRYGELPERQARVVARIASSGDRMARMIDDLLDFARSRLGGEFPMHPRRIDLRQISEQTIEELEFAYTRQVKLDAQGDLWGDWDPDRIAQVVSNLVGNALQHSDGEVTVTLRAEKDFVVLETHNGGPPIPPEVLPHVFEPGRRGDARSGGLGLGLFIVQQIVLAHGGSIEVTSSEEKGTTFTLALPRKRRQKS